MKQPNINDGKMSEINTAELNLCKYNRFIHYKYRNKEEKIFLKSIMIINTIMGSFEIMQYDDKCAFTIMNLVETMSQLRYPWTI